MKKKIGIFLVVFLISTIISASVSYANSKKKTPVTITVKIKSLYSNYYCYEKDYFLYDNLDGTNYVNKAHASASFREALGVSGSSEWITNSGNRSGAIPDSKLEPGKFALGYNQKDVKVSPSIKGGYGDYSDKLSMSTATETRTYSFEFQDNKDVQVVIAAYNAAGNGAGSVTGKINFLNANYLTTDDELINLGGNPNGGRGIKWNAADWYRLDTNYPSNDKAYTTGNLSLKQNADSSCLEIVSTDPSKGVKDTTVTVYIGCEQIGVHLGGSQDVSHVTIDSGVYKKEGSNQQKNTTPVANNNGNADSYNVYTNYKTQYQPFNNWKVVQSYVNKLIDTIELISYAYYGIAFITSILMLIINIVAIAGATNNPVMRTRVFMRFGISILCFALLGASFLLTRLFILTCMSS